MHFYRWAELIPYFWEFEHNILNALLHSGIVQTSGKQKMGNFLISYYIYTHVGIYRAEMLIFAI